MNKYKKISDVFLQLFGTEHIEFWLCNAKHAANNYHNAFDLDIVAFARLETD